MYIFLNHCWSHASIGNLFEKAITLFSNCFTYMEESIKLQKQIYFLFMEYFVYGMILNLVKIITYIIFDSTYGLRSVNYLFFIKGLKMVTLLNLIYDYMFLTLKMSICVYVANKTVKIGCHLTLILSHSIHLDLCLWSITSLEL